MVMNVRERRHVMVTTAYERKLVAVLYADAKGYTRLMGQDEERTLQLINASLERFSRLITEYGGAVVNVAGDGVLADFPSVTRAVECGVAMQTEPPTGNNGREATLQIQFRIGINAGDVILNQDNIHGDAVNIAVRIEEFAPVGSVCISRPVYDQTKNKLAYGYEYLGQHQLKNIEEPIEIYQVQEDPKRAMDVPSVRQTPAPLAPPDFPSIAVLPFNDMSEAGDHGYLCDGITEDITTSLSRFHNLFVIARNSAFVFKEKKINVQEVGRELGVRYVLEGSVRSARERLRINAQLIDTRMGFHLWAEKYDRELDDPFMVQDELTQSIVMQLAVKMEGAELQRTRGVQTENLEAYALLLRAQEAFYGYTREGHAKARALCKKAIEHDPQFARAYALLSRTYNDEWRYSWCEDPEESLRNALRLAKVSVALDHTDARGYCELGIVYLYQKKMKASIAEFERALSINPNDADVMAELADALAYDRRPAEAVELIEKAMRLNPFYPDWYLWHLADAYYALRRYEDTIATVERMNNPAEGCRLLAASYGQLGLLDEARSCAQMVLQRQPNFTISRWAAVQPEQNPDELEHFIEGLRKAGLPK